VFGSNKKNLSMCLQAFIMTEQWLKKPKMLMPSPVAVECQKIKMHQPPQNSGK